MGRRSRLPGLKPLSSPSYIRFFDFICINPLRCANLLVGAGTSMCVRSSYKLNQIATGTGPQGQEDSEGTGVQCTRLREVSVCHPWSESTASLLRTIRSPHLKRFVIHLYRSAHRDFLRTDQDLDVWTRTDGEPCEAYNQWTKHVTGKIEVIFVQKFSCSSVGYQEYLEEFFPRSIEKSQ